jgi:putative FmdB family regulatory protein
MPLFEYQCDGCGHRLEVLQKHDDPPPVCAPCDEQLPPETPYMSRQVSTSSFRLEGSGWARDSYGLNKGEG